MGFCRLALVCSIVSIAASVVACGYSGHATLDAVQGDQEPGSSGSGPGSSNGTTLPDGAPVVGSVPGSVPICNPPGCAMPTPPAGWELVLLGSSRADACPAGFDALDAIESPVAGANACACAACVTTGTNCASGAIGSGYDTGGGGCGSTGGQLQTNAGLCRNMSATFSQNARIDAPTPVLGTCQSAASAVPANVKKEDRRVCTRQASTCSDKACGAPSSLQACIAAPGDVACPAGVTTKHLVGSDVTLACPACGCTITSAKCGGTMDFYSQSNCSGSPFTTLTVGVCKAVGGADMQSTKWKPIVGAQLCATVPAAPTIALTAAQTICCP